MGVPSGVQWQSPGGVWAKPIEADEFVVTRNSSGDEIPERFVLLPLLRLTALTERFPWDDLRKILHGGQRMAKVQIVKKYC